MEKILQDVRFAFRMYRRRPGFTAVVVLTLALGIGANTAIFSVFNAVLLRSLPYPRPSRLVTLWETNAEKGREQDFVSPPTFMDWRRLNRSFQGLAAYSGGSFVLKQNDHAQKIPGMSVTQGFFDILGVPARLGRTFTAADMRPGAPAVAIISFNLWSREFGSDSHVSGKALDLDGVRYTVIGVLPPQFSFPNQADIWVPLIFPSSSLVEGMRGARYIQALGRLKPGITLSQAGQNMQAVALELGKRHPNNSGWGVRLIPLSELVSGPYQESLWILLGAVALVLLVAFSNVANVNLAHGAARARETALRTALGAGRRRLLLQSTIESTLLALLGGVLGILTAAWATPMIQRLIAEKVSAFREVRIDVPVLIFTLVISMACGVLLGVMSTLNPLLKAPFQMLKGRGPGSRWPAVGSRARGALVVSEVALCTILLVAAGLLGRSFLALKNVNPGFRQQNALLAPFSLPSNRYSAPAQQVHFFQELISRTRRISGVVSVAAGTNIPLTGSRMEFGFEPLDSPVLNRGEQPRSQYHAVTPGYFQALGIPLKAGRDFRSSDQESSAPVALVNETLARRYWPGQEVVGKRIMLVSKGGEQEKTVIGVVGDVRHRSLKTPVQPEVYVPFAQDPWNFATLVVRTGDQNENLIPALRTRLAELDPEIPLDSVAWMEERVAATMSGLRSQLLLVGAFALLALILAVVGVYGVVSYVVSLRTSEIGIRLALGAAPVEAFGLILRFGLLLGVSGVLIGAISSLFLTRLLGHFLFGVQPIDPLTLSSVSTLLLVAALGACLLPARRAMTVDPVQALRCE